VTRVAHKRISSNILIATGPVSAGGDQQRDAESFHTRIRLRKCSEPPLAGSRPRRSGFDFRNVPDRRCQRSKPQLAGASG
jgi:hypothetical protein